MAIVVIGPRDILIVGSLFMPSFKDQWIAKTRFNALFRAEVAIARAASHLALQLSAASARSAAETAATSAWCAAEAVSRQVPRSVLRRTPSPGSTLTAVLRTAASLGDGVALLLLEWVLRLQNRRMRWALDVVDHQAHDVILRVALPRRLEALAALRRARADRAAPGLETAR